MEKLLSIVIPTYNMEKYLNKCLDSLIVPELSCVEVLVINDGSKDRSSAISHTYSKKYPGSFSVVDKSNGNYGSCINCAIKIAKGKYIKILDADDYFSSDAFSRFIRELRDTDADVIITDYARVNEKYQICTHCRCGLDATSIMSYEEAYPIIRVFNQMHALTYRLEYIRHLNYTQTEGISYTDTEWTFIPLASGERYSFINCGELYQYLVGRSDQTMSPTVFFNKLPDQFKVLLSRARKLERHKITLSDRRLMLLKESFLNQAQYIYLSILLSSNKEAKRLLDEFEYQLREISENIYLSVGNLNYTPAYHYKMVKHFRESRNRNNFSIPKIVRLIGKARSGIKRIFVK